MLVCTSGEWKWSQHASSVLLQSFLLFCAHRSLLASASADHTTRVWDLSELKCALTLPHPDKVNHSCQNDKA